MTLLATGFFIRSIDGAHAAPGPERFLQQGTNKIGKYMMSLSVTSDGYRSVLVWDTESGKSKMYLGTGLKFKVEEGQLSGNPLD
jgi:hypothetical protein